MTELSVSTCFDYGVPIDQQLVLIAAAGFTHVSPSRADHAGYLDESRRHDLAARLADHGLGVDTIHGPDLMAADAVGIVAETAAAAAELGAGLWWCIRPGSLLSRMRWMMSCAPPGRAWTLRSNAVARLE